MNAAKLAKVYPESPSVPFQTIPDHGRVSKANQQMISVATPVPPKVFLPSLAVSVTFVYLIFMNVIL